MPSCNFLKKNYAETHPILGSFFFHSKNLTHSCNNNMNVFINFVSFVKIKPKCSLLSLPLLSLKYCSSSRSMHSTQLCSCTKYFQKIKNHYMMKLQRKINYLLIHQPLENSNVFKYTFGSYPSWRGPRECWLKAWAQEPDCLGGDPSSTAH